MLTVADVATRLGMANDQPPTLQALVESAYSFIQAQTHRYFGLPVVQTNILRGTGGYRLWLPETPVDTIASPVVVAESLPGTSTTTAVTGFVIRSDGTSSYLARQDGQIWRWGYDYGVTFKRGYREDQGPFDIDQLVVALVSLNLTQAAGGTDLASETLEGVYNYNKASAAAAAATIAAIPGAQATLDAWSPPVIAT